MAYLKKIEHYFWIYLIFSVALGFITPRFFLPYEGYIVHIIMVIMGLLYLKVDILDIVTHVKKPLYLLYICFSNLIIIPIIVFFIFRPLGNEISTALLLLAALPAGVSSAAFTDIMKGKTSLNLTLIIFSNLFAVFTIPFLFYILMGTHLNLDHMELFLNLFKIIFIPFIIAKAIKHTIVKNLKRNIEDSYNFLIIILLGFMIMISIAYQSEYILNNILMLSKTLGILFIAFILLQLLGYASVFWRKKGEKLAVSNSNMIMNNVLGIVLAIAFFPDSITTIVILSLIPWNVMIIAKHWYKRYLP